MENSARKLSSRRGWCRFSPAREISRCRVVKQTSERRLTRRATHQISMLLETRIRKHWRDPAVATICSRYEISEKSPTTTNPNETSGVIAARTSADEAGLEEVQACEEEATSSRRSASSRKESLRRHLGVATTTAEEDPRGNLIPWKSCRSLES